MENVMPIKTEPIDEDDTIFQESLLSSCNLDIKMEADSTSLLVPSVIKEEASSSEHQTQILTDTESLIQNTRMFTEYNGHRLVKKVLCPVCNCPFSSLWHLRQHVATHSKNKPKDSPFSCSMCGKGFSGQIALDRHMIDHSGKVYTCPQCMKEFPTRKRFNHHIDFVHSLVKRFSCSYCSKAFTVKNFLVCHMRTHTGEKPFICPKCNKGFTQKGAMKRHLEVVCGMDTRRCRKSRSLPLNAKEISADNSSCNITVNLK